MSGTITRICTDRCLLVWVVSALFGESLRVLARSWRYCSMHGHRMQSPCMTFRLSGSTSDLLVIWRAAPLNTTFTTNAVSSSG